MITRHHVALALMCSLTLAVAVVPFDPALFLVLVTSICVGSILPDIQMTKPKKICAITLAWLIVQFTKRACMPLMCSCYRIIPGLCPEPGDKRLTHSVPGILFITIILAGILYSISAIAGQFHLPGAAKVFLAGAFLGMILHLAQDLCTRKGIAPFFPFSDCRISGSIRPCDTRDRRIAQFHAQHGSILTLFMALDLAGMIPAGLILPAGFAGSAVCIAWMISLSSVKIYGGDTLLSRIPQGTPVAG